MVLGFLSFMVVSAVAFAIYMRAERVPSSALRRNVATRHLVKAALAHAMSRVDDAIRADPFPGHVNTNNMSSANFYHDGKDNAMDMWYGRVFMPPDPEGITDQANDPSNIGDSYSGFASRFAPITETVSTLTLEALGYIPPPLVNDVRFLSRSTWTAKWQNFAYDAGRFAFCAVNVSDYFDINRVSADIRSSSPDSRISVAHLLRGLGGNARFSDVDESALNAFNTLFGPDATARPRENNFPYVSMLDYNLALGTKGSSGINNIIRSCFYWWIEGGSREFFYFNGSTDSSDGVKSAMRQPFVTDSWATNETYKVADFAKLEGQPFRDMSLDNDNATMDEVIRSKAKFNSQEGLFAGNGPFRGLTGEEKGYLLFSLYDYLDHDSIPLSLVAPSVECVPMVTAIEPIVKSRLKFTQKPPVKDPQTQPRDGDQTTTTTWTIDPSSLSRPAVRVLFAFPFRHTRERKTRNDFYAQVVLKVFVASGAVPLYPSGDLSKIRPVEKADWSGPSKAFETPASGAFVWSFCSSPQRISLPTSMESQDDAIISLNVSSWNGDATIPADQAVFSQIDKESFVNGISKGKTTTYKFNLRPFKDGALLPDGDLTDVSAYQADQYRSYAAVWVRVTSSDGAVTYDLAPAIVQDDEKLNGGGNTKNYVRFYGDALSELSCSFLKFSSPDNPFYTYADLSLANGSEFDWVPKSLAVADPRYNYMSEDWYAWDQSGINGGAWLDAISDPGDGFLNDADCDHDIFMFTSDQGYLQSLGEFAFLPRLARNGARMQDISGATVHPATMKATRSANYAWRTYVVDKSLYDEFAIAGIGRSSHSDQTVNPYTDNAEVLYAAFANTPCSYWVTGRTAAGIVSDLPKDFKEIVNKLGDTTTEYGGKIDKMSESLKHAFCELNEDSELRIRSEDVRAIARNVGNQIGSFMPESANEENADLWKEAYDDLPWFSNLNAQNDDTFKSFMGVSLDHPLYSVDRKFLYSYWRDCFANKQQLFLIFVRAESSALGGSGEGTPSQQGGRAVALVWRDPQSNTTDGGRNGASDDRQRIYQNTSGRRRPHRMRVLFYHQFD